jgi:arylsulfatase A-like enzyme
VSDGLSGFRKLSSCCAAKTPASETPVRILSFGLFLASCLGGSSPARAADRPNLIVMMCDDQRFDAMSCAGNPVLKTPNMDRLAREGARFQNMFVTHALCSPSRATLLTGLYSHTHGVIDNTPKMKPVPLSIPFVSELLRKEGYEVGFAGKSHNKGSFRDRPWDFYFGFQDQGQYINPKIAEGTTGKDEVRTGWMDDVVTDKAIEWITKKRDKPFCLFLFFKAPHRSWTRAPRHADLFKDTTIPTPDLWDADRSLKPKAFANADNKIGDAKDVATYESFLKDYYSVITGVDENIGKVLKALESTNQLDSTAVFHTSDNGFFAGEWKAYDKRFMHEPSIRVPLLVRYPKMVKPGITPKEMVINCDFAPTLLELAGLPVPKEMHGRSIVPVLKGQPGEGQKEWRKDWMYEYYEFPRPHNVPPHRGVRTDKWKYIHYYKETPEEFELYDLEKDPKETVNLYGKPEFAAITATLKKRLAELRTETGDRD